MPIICSVSGFGASEVVTDKGVSDLLARLPQAHTRSSALRSIAYVNEIKHEAAPPAHRRFPRHQIFGEWTINEETNDGNATIYRQHGEGNPREFDFLRTILHEVAHAVYQQLSEEDRLEWAKQHEASVVIMNEQSRVAEEHFCHLYAIYVLRHEMVKSGFNHLHTFLRERVFEGAEY